MTVSFWQHAHHEQDVVCDVAVVGGGLIGCSTAYWLRRRRRALRVAIVEARRLASGASGRNAGFLLQGTVHDYLSDRAVYGEERARRLWHFTRENRDLIFSELRGRTFGLEASGSLMVAASREEDARLQASVSRMRADGAPVAYIPPDEANRRLVSQGFQGALYVPSGGMLDPVALVAHIAAESGALVLEHHPVLGLDLEQGEVRLDTPVRTVRAGCVVLALNAYLPRLFPALGRYVRPVRAQMLATRRMVPRWLQVPAYTHEGHYYVRQTMDGTILLGGARHLHVPEEVGYKDATTPTLQADLERYLHLHFPQTRSLEVRRRWSGVMGFSPDHLPVIGSVPDLPGSFWAAGFTGHGIGYGFRFGRLMAELSLGDPQPEGLDLFHVDRFTHEEQQLTLRSDA